MKCYWQKYLSPNFQSRESEREKISKKKRENLKKVSWDDEKGELMVSSWLFHLVKNRRWCGQKRLMTLSETVFDEKFSREFSLKVPFCVCQNWLIFITHCFSKPYKKAPKFASFGPRRVFAQKIVCIWAENCQFIQQILKSPTLREHKRFNLTQRPRDAEKPRIGIGRQSWCYFSHDNFSLCHAFLVPLQINTN